MEFLSSAPEPEPETEPEPEPEPKLLWQTLYELATKPGTPKPTAESMRALVEANPAAAAAPFQGPYGRAGEEDVGELVRDGEDEPASELGIFVAHYPSEPYGDRSHDEYRRIRDGDTRMSFGGLLCGLEAFKGLRAVDVATALGLAEDVVEVLAAAAPQGDP